MIPRGETIYKEIEIDASILVIVDVLESVKSFY